jgi:hypothetical protein
MSGLTQGLLDKRSKSDDVKIYYVGVARVQGDTAYLIGGYSYSATPIDIDGIKQLLQESHTTMLPGSHYKISSGPFAWNIIPGIGLRYLFSLYPI